MMASAWGSSWGSAWGDSWGAIEVFGRSGLGGDDVPRRRSPHRGWNKEEWKARVKDQSDELETLLQQTYDRLTGKEAPVSVLARVDAIVRPVAKAREADLPLRIDWRKMAADYERSQRLFALAREEDELRAIEEDDEDVIMLVMQ